MGMPDAWNALAVLTGADDERDRCFAGIGVPIDDAELVRAVIANTGRLDELRPSPGAIARLCAVIRGLGALIDGAIAADELRTGLAVHERATGGFHHFGIARVPLRTVSELVAEGSRAAPQPVLRQVRGWLIDALEDWLIGDDPGALNTELEEAAPGDAAWLQMEHPSAELLALADEFTGLRSALTGPERDRQIALAARRSDWTAMPRPAERFTDDEPALARLVAEVDTPELWAVSLAPDPWWRMTVGLMIEPRTDGRSAWTVPTDIGVLAELLTGQPSPLLLTTPAMDLVVVEARDYHVLAGPADTVEAICGVTPAEARAAFRDWVDGYYGDDDPPPHLVRIAGMYAHPRRVPPLGGWM